MCVWYVSLSRRKEDPVDVPVKRFNEIDLSLAADLLKPADPYP